MHAYTLHNFVEKLLAEDIYITTLAIIISFSHKCTFKATKIVIIELQIL